MTEKLIVTGVTTGSELVDAAGEAAETLVQLTSCPEGVCDGSGICPPVRLEDNERECACRV